MWHLAMHLILASSAVAADSFERIDDPGVAIFVGDRVEGEGAPSRASLGTSVLLHDLDEDDPYFEAVSMLERARRPEATLRYPEREITAVESELRRLAPEFVFVVTRPDRVDVNLHLELLELAARIDADPFVDFTFGYVTGATAEETTAFVSRFLAEQKKRKGLPKTVLEFGPARNGTTSKSGPSAHGIAKGWKESRIFHGPVDDLLDGKQPLQGYGLLRAGGHGMPDGVVDGLKGTELRELDLDLSPAIYFSGPCYCGVTGDYYVMEQGAMRRRSIDPEASFALAAIAGGVTALFAGLDPDRGETTSQEMEHLLIHGDTLGHAIKETYDGCALALRKSAFSLYRYEDGGGRPARNLSERMIGAAAGRALFGDPTWAPFASAAPLPFPVKVRDRRDHLELTWKSDQAPTKYWMANDVFHCDGGWTHRIQFRVEVPAKTAAQLSSFEVARLRAKDGDLTGRFATAMVERWGGRAFVHVYVAFPVEGNDRVFFRHREFDARFRFAKQ